MCKNCKGDAAQKDKDICNHRKGKNRERCKRRQALHISWGPLLLQRLSLSRCFLGGFTRRARSAVRCPIRLPTGLFRFFFGVLRGVLACAARLLGSLCCSFPRTCRGFFGFALNAARVAFRICRAVTRRFVLSCAVASRCGIGRSFARARGTCACGTCACGTRARGIRYAVARSRGIRRRVLRALLCFAFRRGKVDSLSAVLAEFCPGYYLVAAIRTKHLFLPPQIYCHNRFLSSQNNRTTTQRTPRNTISHFRKSVRAVRMYTSAR